MISLFWKIGKELTVAKKQNGELEDEVSLIDEASRLLYPLFGSYLSFQELKIMSDFSERCSEETLNKIAPFTNWQYIPEYLKVADENLWFSYVILTQEQSLTPVALRGKILEETYKSTVMLDESKRLSSILFTPPESFYKETIELYFGKHSGEAFRQLFESQTRSIPISITDQATEGNKEVLLNIYNTILEYQSTYGHLLNIQFNVLHWQLGEEIIRLSDMFQVRIEESLGNKSFSDLCEHFPSLFNHREVVDCVKFASVFNSSNFMEISQRVSWTYLKVLLDLNEENTMLIVADRVLDEGISLIELKEKVSNGTYSADNIVDFPQPFATITKGSSQKNGNRKKNQLSVNSEIMTPKINPSNSVNSNIFAIPELLTFIMEGVVPII